MDEQIATVGDDSDLRAYQTQLFHSTGQTRWKTLPAYEMFVEMLPRSKIADAQSETFRNLDELVESAFGFSIRDAITFSYVLGGLAYDWETCLYCLFTDPGMVVSDAQKPNERSVPWFNAEREPALRSWLQYHSDDLDEKARLSSLDLRTWSGFGFGGFYRKPFIQTQTGEKSFVSTRIEWIQNLASVECIYHLCREALVEHRLPDEQWRSYYGRLLEEYVVAEVGRRKPRNVWRENEVPGLETHDGPRCDVVVETRDGYSVIEVKAAVPDVKVATGEDPIGLDHYLRRISVGLHPVAGETDLKEGQPPLRQIEGTLMAANLDSAKPTIAAVVTGSHVPIHLGHFDRMAGWWQEEVGSGGGPTGLMYQCRVLPIDVSGIAALVAYCRQTHTGLHRALTETYSRFTNSLIATSSPLNWVGADVEIAPIAAERRMVSVIRTRWG